MGYQPWIGLPNILARDFIVPELLQHAATPQAMADALWKQLQDDGNVQEDWLVMRLELKGDKLVIRQLKDDYMKEKNIASAEQLRKVIEQSMDDGSMYDKEEVFTATRLAAN